MGQSRAHLHPRRPASRVAAPVAPPGIAPARTRTASVAALAALAVLLLPATAAAQGASGADGGAGVGTALSVARALRYLGIGGAVGVLVLVLVAWNRRAGRDAPAASPVDAAFRRSAGTLLRASAVLAALAALAALLLTGVSRTGGGLGDALDPGALGDGLGTRAGAWYAVSALAAGALAVLAHRSVAATGGLRDPGPGARPAQGAAALSAVLVVAPALGGHAVSSPTSGVLVPVQVLHVAAMAAWFGGLLALVLVLPRALRAAPGEPERLAGTAAVLLRFSPLALGAVAVLTLAGTALAVLHLTTLYDLTDTAYGRAILVKVVLLTAAIGVAVVQRELLVPQLQRLAAGEQPAEPDPDPVHPEEDEEDPDAPEPPRRLSAAAPRHVRLAIRTEALLVVAVLGATGALTGYPPPRTHPGGPAVVERSAGTLRLRLVVDPARTGPNGVRLRVTGAGGRVLPGLPTPGVRALPPGRIGGSDVPVDVLLRPDGPGAWRADGVPLGTRGGWRFAIIVRVPGADPVRVRVPVRVR